MLLILDFYSFLQLSFFFFVRFLEAQNKVVPIKKNYYFLIIDPFFLQTVDPFVKKKSHEILDVKRCSI